MSWWRQQMETFSALMALCAGNSLVTGQRPMTRSLQVFFDLGLNKQLSKQLRRRWFETPSHPLWRHCNVLLVYLNTVWQMKTRLPNIKVVDINRYHQNSCKIISEYHSPICQFCRQSVVQNHRRMHAQFKSVTPTAPSCILFEGVLYILPYCTTSSSIVSMMTSSNGNIFRVIGPLCVEFTGHRWIPLTRAIDADVWYFLWSVSE